MDAISFVLGERGNNLRVRSSAYVPRGARAVDRCELAAYRISFMAPRLASRPARDAEYK